MRHNSHFSYELVSVRQKKIYYCWTRVNFKTPWKHVCTLFFFLISQLTFAPFDKDSRVLRGFASHTHASREETSRRVSSTEYCDRRFTIRWETRPSYLSSDVIARNISAVSIKPETRAVARSVCTNLFQEFETRIWVGIFFLSETQQVIFRTPKSFNWILIAFYVSSRSLFLRTGGEEETYPSEEILVRDGWDSRRGDDGRGVRLSRTIRSPPSKRISLRF